MIPRVTDTHTHIKTRLTMWCTAYPCWENMSVERECTFKICCFSDLLPHADQLRDRKHVWQHPDANTGWRLIIFESPAKILFYIYIYVYTILICSLGTLQLQYCNYQQTQEDCSFLYQLPYKRIFIYVYHTWSWWKCERGTKRSKREAKRMGERRCGLILFESVVRRHRACCERRLFKLAMDGSSYSKWLKLI